MDRNERKIQILQILLDSGSSLAVSEIADAAAMVRHHALVMCSRYQNQGLLVKTGSNPSQFSLSRRGRERLFFLRRAK